MFNKLMTGSWLLREMAYDLRGLRGEWAMIVAVAVGIMAFMWLACAWAAM